MKILCVDDSKDNCDLLSFILFEAGYEVESAQSIVEGLQMAQTGEFKLYLVDLSFSDGNGFDLIQKLRMIDPTIPIIICSGDARETARTEATRVGIQTFLLKPIEPDSLADTIAEILNNKQTV